MKAVKKFWRKLNSYGADDRGSALVIVTLLLALLTIYISASLTASTTDAIASNFEVAQQKAFYTAYSKLEQMSRDFSSLFAAAIAPGYDPMCVVVLKDPSLINNFRIVKPQASCPPGGNCSPSYSKQSLGWTDIYDLGWVGSSSPFCMIDVCNPNATPVCDLTSDRFKPRPPVTKQVEKGDFAGLQGFFRRYRMAATAVSENRGGADVQVTRDFDNILLPLFQFGIFSDTDFELYDPPNWAFGGWVHTNGDFYVTSAAGRNSISFSQYIFNRRGNLVRTGARITVAKHVVVGDGKSGIAVPNSQMNVFSDATNIDPITVGSAINGPNVPNCKGITPNNEAPPGNCNASFGGTPSGTLKLGVPKLQLPLQNAAVGASPIQLIKRGLPSDVDVGLGSPLVGSRYYYKPGIRITLADYQNQLPCDVKNFGDLPSGTNPCNHGGVQLDGPDPWLGDNVGGGPGLVKPGSLTNPSWYYQEEDPTKPNTKRPIPRGYQPKISDQVNGRPTGARVNGYRIHGWIKIELVRTNGNVRPDGATIKTFDITQEILNLGVTVPYLTSPGTFYYPTFTPGFPVAGFKNGVTGGPFPDENSIIHLQRFAVPYTTAITPGVSPLPADPTGLSPALNRLDQGANPLNFDYYASMALRDNNGSGLGMYGIEDDQDKRPNPPPPAPQHPIYTTRYDNISAKYAEPQPDPGGYYTDTFHALAPAASLTPTQIDFTGGGGATRSGTNYFGENVNLPKNKNTNTTGGRSAVLNPTGETTWQFGPCTGLNDCRLFVPFPINIFDSREGVPHEPTTAPGNPPIPGMGVASAPTKNGVMNLVEIDMGNLGRMLKGDFDQLFAQMTQTPYRLANGPLRASDMRDNININQDNGWLVYISDRRGDEPMHNNNPNIKPGTGQPLPAVADGTPRVIGDGEYNREDVVWNPGGSTNTGSSAAIPVKTSTLPLNNSANPNPYGCVTGSLLSDNQDKGKSPQDANNDCFIESEDRTGQYSETALYSARFNADQYIPNPTPPYTDLSAASAGNMVAMTQVGTNQKQSWSIKPPVVFDPNPNNLRVEMFRRGVRLVNASNLFPTGPAINQQCSTQATPIYLGITVSTENPVYVFGNYNAPAGKGIDLDQFPGINGPPGTGGVPTSPANYNGQTFATCGANCHVPAAIVADAITLLSSACVGNSNPNWTTFAGWLDARSFITPYQALAYRPARNSVYRFALISGFTPSWFPNFWGSPNSNQGPAGSPYSSGALNNFPRFLEDWGQNSPGTNLQTVTYAGSLIRIFKSRQANGAFKRIGNANSVPSVDYVYRPPSRDWIFDLDFSSPCTLPPGSPFLQLLDFKGFQQSVIQR